jgi:hypothetical protein
MARGSAIPSVIGGLIIIVAGIAVGLVEALRWPKGSIWLVVGGAVASLLVLRRLTRPRP